MLTQLEQTWKNKTMRGIAKLGLMVAVAASGAAAQDAITLKADGLTCAVRGWSFGATGAPAVATGSAAKSQITNLVTARQLDDCSVKFFESAVRGLRFNQVTLTQTDPSTGVDLIKVDLQNVSISSYQIAGDTTSPNPGESVAFAFMRISVTSRKPSGAVIASFSWDLQKSMTPP